MQTSSRRQFLKASLAAGAAIGFPTIVPSTVFGASAPSNMIHLAQIGCGRIARTWDIPALLKLGDHARYVAVCDFDSVRVADAKQQIESAYAKAFGKEKYANLRTSADYRELLQDKDIDAVAICTPDHWHAQPAIEAALAGKDVYVQKPMTLTIHEGRQLADTIKKTGRILQIGSQLRSQPHFRLACELVRNGRIGKVREIFLGLAPDPSGGKKDKMPVPANFNYEAWLGSTPLVDYTLDRVHPQGDLKIRYGRPGWLRCEQFGAGMITGWGAHDIDMAHWGMGTARTGPIQIEAHAEFPKEGLWDVHGDFSVEALYANGVQMHINGTNQSGIKWVGENGWLWATRISATTPSDPKMVKAKSKGKGKSKSGERLFDRALDASDRKILTAGIKDGEVRLHASPKDDHHLDWLTSIRTRQEPVAPAEEGHRSCSACLIAHIGMKLGRKLTWDPEKERFVGDDAANAMLTRAQRAPYGTDRVLG